MPDTADSDTERCDQWLQEVQDHLREELLPFWRDRGVDDKAGGYLTYFDAKGHPTGETLKTLVCQTRMIYSDASLVRAGFDPDGHFLERAARGVDFFVEHFWDEEHGGWYWTTDCAGSPLNDSKIVYGQSFAMLALSEYGMASGDYRGMEWASRTFECVQTFAADNLHGGYYEFFERDWRRKAGGRAGGDRKSFDVHMHLMEAFTNLFEATGADIYRRRTLEIMGVLQSRMLHSEFGTGIAQFTADFEPLRAIRFEDVWGADRDAGDPAGRPLDNTSYGHNVECAWLLLHAVRTLGLGDDECAEVARKLVDHCVRYGIDHERRGVFCEGPHNGPARERNKEFWQQAEAMAGLLEAYRQFGDRAYLDAYGRVHRFVMDTMVDHEVGEWRPLFDSENRPLSSDLGTAWKINYHTVRGMLLCEKHLIRITLDS